MLKSQFHPLEKRARELVEALGGTWVRGRGICCCPAHDDRTPSLSVTIGRSAILFHCFAGCSIDEVLRALSGAGVRAADLFDGTGSLIEVVPRSAPPNRNALRLWREATTLAESPAASYLARRAIETGTPELRFHPQMPLGPKGQVQFLPAMVAAVRNDQGILALHRTFLDVDSGCLAQFERPRRALGSLGTGAVRLGRPRGDRLGLAEGIETALSAAQLFGVPCWATLGNERFGQVTIPESVRELHLFVDNDAGGDLAEARARAAYGIEGRRIVAQRPRRVGFDWNDVLTRQKAKA